MSRAFAVTRALVTLWLVLSLSVAAVVPPLAGGLTGPRRADSVAKPCCCGTADGHCCGKVCRVSPAPEREPTPQPSPRNDRNPGSLDSAVLAFAPVALTAVVVDQPVFSPEHLASARFLSLRALQVRLQI